MSEAAPKLFTCYLAQGGCNMTCVVDDETAQAIHQHLYIGESFGLWMYSGPNNSRLTGVIINPMLGGIVLSLGPAADVLVDKQGNIARSPDEVAGKILPKDQPRGRLNRLGWPASPRGLRAEFEQKPGSPPVKEQPPEAPGPPGA